MVKVHTKISNADVPLDVVSLVEARVTAKQNKEYTQADDLRKKVEVLGYLINDKSSGDYEILKIGDKDKKPKRQYLILFGSGEIAPSSVDIYRSTFLTLDKRDLTISLITTPAGFQPNVTLVYQEIKDFLLASLPDFNLTINIVEINTRSDADSLEKIAQMQGSDILFLGPGSPTYAVKILKNTKAILAIENSIKNGTSLILASAATISFSKYSLPVYEIYKVGEDLHWVDGLNLYERIWQQCSIIPHFNNREGGVGLDTSYCYLGKSRAEKLLTSLPHDHKVMGIDEHTAMVIDLGSGTHTVHGKGKIWDLI